MKNPDSNRLKKRNYTIGSVISIQDTYYPISYWYVYGFCSKTYTLIKLDNEFRPILGNNAQMIKVFKDELNSRLIQDPTYSLKPDYREVYIPSYYVFDYHQNCCGTNLRYGDIVLVQTQYMTYQPFFILNKEDDTHIVYDMGNKEYRYDTSVSGLVMPFTQYTIISNLKLRSEIMEKAIEVQGRLKSKNYAPIEFFDDYIKFTRELDYIMEKEETKSSVNNDLQIDMEELQQDMAKLNISDNEDEDEHITGLIFNNYELEPLTYEDFPVYDSFIEYNPWTCNEPISPTFLDVYNSPIIDDEKYIDNLKKTVHKLEIIRSNDSDEESEVKTVSTHIEIEEDSDDEFYQLDKESDDIINKIIDEVNEEKQADLEAEYDFLNEEHDETFNQSAAVCTIM